MEASLSCCHGGLAGHGLREAETLAQSIKVLHVPVQIRELDAVLLMLVLGLV